MCVLFAGIGLCLRQKKGENYDGKLRKFHWQESIDGIVEKPGTTDGLGPAAE